MHAPGRPAPCGCVARRNRFAIAAARFPSARRQVSGGVHSPHRHGAVQPCAAVHRHIVPEVTMKARSSASEQDAPQIFACRRLVLCSARWESLDHCRCLLQCARFLLLTRFNALAEARQTALALLLRLNAHKNATHAVKSRCPRCARAADLGQRGRLRPHTEPFRARAAFDRQFPKFLDMKTVIFTISEVRDRH
eukprot:6206014-Pleurochrysis_carterae.AAC.2